MSQTATSADVFEPELLGGSRAPSTWADSWRRLRRNRLALASLIFLIVVLVVALFAPLLTSPVLGIQFSPLEAPQPAPIGRISSGATAGAVSPTARASH